MKLYLYARVSTIDQNTDQQIEYMRKWCKNNNHEIVGMVKDKQSGRLPLTERKNFKGLLERAQSNNDVDAILVKNLDRLTRNWDDVTFIERFFRENWDICKLVSCGDVVDLASSTGRLVFRQMMAIHCYMPESMRDNQIVGIARAKKEGKYKGRKPGSKNKKRSN